MFTSIIADSSAGLTIGSVAICTAVSLILGFVIACIHKSDGVASKNFLISLVLLPTLVQVVIMLVNGNLGTSVAVLGAFSLVRFRSAPGSAKEISCIFFSMAVGLATGTGYVVFAAIITIIVGIVLFLLSKISFGEAPACRKEFRVTIPENVDSPVAFADILQEFTQQFMLNDVRFISL